MSKLLPGAAVTCAAKWFFFLILLLQLHLSFVSAIFTSSSRLGVTRAVVNVEGGPESVVWVAQLSDLHFSVHHPERAHDFRRFVGPALAMIRPALVLVTGDLTDGKSQDLLIMKQNEKEWMEYRNVMDDVAESSGLDGKLFYDLRGNHDNFGVPEAGGDYDFYNKYSNNAVAGRRGNVHSVTLKTADWEHLFVGFDTTMDVGPRGPTNLFGHPSDELISDVDKELLQWDSELRDTPLTKILFGHFPLSFSAPSESGNKLKDVFLKHSISAYLCGHLHSRFGTNLKRHHVSRHYFPFSTSFYQLNVHEDTVDGVNEECLNRSEPVKEFWEWEMGDWRKRRTMRIIAIDEGYVSFLDLRLTSADKKVIILPTFPLDSRFMQRNSFNNDYRCSLQKTINYETLRTLVFANIRVDAVFAKIYDSRSGNLDLVVESSMRKLSENGTRGDLYVTPWNWRAFSDSPPDRYWLQIEAIDMLGRSTFSELRPFSINGIHAKVNWTWKEFFVMGVQWGYMYPLLLWGVLSFLFSLLLVPWVFTAYCRKHNMRGNFFPCFTNRNILISMAHMLFWILLEFSKVTLLWTIVLSYLLFLTCFPWFFGTIFTETGTKAYMTIGGWSIHTRDKNGKVVYIYTGVPDIMVIVLPHLVFALLPAIFILSALVAEKESCRVQHLSVSGKKKDDYYVTRREHKNLSCRLSDKYWLRTILFFLSAAVLWKHWKQCRALMKAYEMNPFLHAPVYCFLLPSLLLYTFWKTAKG